MLHIEVVIGLLAGVALLGAIAERAGLPYAAVLVIGGLVLGLAPGVPHVRLDPELVLLGFLPPLVFAAAFEASNYDLRANAGHIISLATVLVLVTVGAVAVIGHAVAGLPWVAAFVLGALAAPTDPVSAGAVMRQAGAPERILAILEGESLINDGTGLAAFQVAVGAAAGAISIETGIARFVIYAVGGCAIGLAGGWILVWLRRRLDEASLEIVLSLLAAFGTYAAANAAGCSAVLAAVTAGLYAGRRAEDMSSASTRVQTQPFWEALKFMLESTLFLLVGLQLPTIVDGLPGDALGAGIAEGAAIVAVVLLVRAGWMLVLWVVPALSSLPGRMSRRLGEVPIAAERLSGRELIVLGYSGMRGALSLAGALSIPLIAGGRPFPARDEVIFLVYVVVIGTLLIPSLSLEPLVRRLGLAGDERLAELELRIRARIVHAALARLEELAEEGIAAEETVERLRATFELRLDRIGGPERDGALSEGAADAAAVVRRLRSELIDAERRALEELREEHGLPAQILARIHRDIDLDETRLHV